MTTQSKDNVKCKCKECKAEHEFLVCVCKNCGGKRIEYITK